MRGLLLVDRDNADTVGPYLANFIKPLSNELVIGILTKTGLSAEIPPVFRTFNKTVVVIFYCNDLKLDVAQYHPDFTQYQIMLLSSNPAWLKEAKDLNWGVCHVAKKAGEIYRPHVNRFTQMIRTPLDARDGSAKPTFVLSLDLDETTVFYVESMQQKKVLLNFDVLDFIKKFFSDYQLVANIKIIAVTARNRAAEIRAVASNRDHISVERILIMLVGHLNGLLRREDVEVHYTEQKYEKLVKLYGKAPNTYVLHLDDNNEWTDPFDQSDPLHPRITYAWVQSPSTSGFYPKTPFFPDENNLQRWCFSFKPPGSQKPVETKSSYGTFPSLFYRTRALAAVAPVESTAVKPPSFCTVS